MQILRVLENKEEPIVGVNPNTGVPLIKEVHPTILKERTYVRISKVCALTPEKWAIFVSIVYSLLYSLRGDFKTRPKPKWGHNIVVSRKMIYVNSLNFETRKSMENIFRRYYYIENLEIEPLSPYFQIKLLLIIIPPQKWPWNVQMKKNAYFRGRIIFARDIKPTIDERIQF